MKRILIADDSSTMRRMVRESLRTLEDVRIDEAANGLEVLEQLSLEPVDLLILDLNMPDVHGLEVLRFVRDHQVLRSLPVIVLTTRGDDASRAATLAAGASLYLNKPFEPRALATNVRQLMMGS